MFEFANHNCVAQMNIRRSRIDSELHAQRLPGFVRLLEFGAQLCLRNSFQSAFGEIGELLFHRPEFHRVHFFGDPPPTSTRRPSIRYFPSSTIFTASL